ncbi:MAG TPA: DnaJ domain-containing protein [Cyanophyceae cyanobacterium]
METPIILKDDELKETERFRTGVFCFFNGQLGISFKSAHPGMIWECDRKYLAKSQQAPPYSKKIKCLLPVRPLTFQPLDAPPAQVKVMRQLLELADVVEALLEAEAKDKNDQRCNGLRDRLNQLYDEFLEEYGFIRNCTTYFDGIWNDLRLEVYLLALEGDKGEKADIFYRRLNHPPKELSGQLFFDDDLDKRVSDAFAWCLGWHGQVVLSEVAEKAGVDEEFAERSLLEQGLVLREWLGAYGCEWWEVLGVDSDCSAEELKQARNRMAKEYHPDVNSKPSAELMMKRINAAFEEGLRQIEVSVAA